MGDPNLKSYLGQGSVAAQLVTVMALLPHLEDISCTDLEPRSGDISPAQAHFNVSALLHACSCATSLKLTFAWELPPEQLLLEQEPARFPLQLFGNMTHLRSLDFSLWTDSHEMPPTVGLEDCVSVVSALTRLHKLRLCIYVDDAVSVLPAYIAALRDLRMLELVGFLRLLCAPGWADLPNLETLHLEDCGVHGGGEHAFPGLAALISLTHLRFNDVSTLVRWPSALWCLTRLRVLEHFVNFNYDPPQAALPPACSQLRGLQELYLKGQGYHSFPSVITQLTALSSLCLEKSCFEVLPAGITALASLVNLSLGHRGLGEPGDLDVRVLGDLSAFPRLTNLELYHCAVTSSCTFADAANHPMFESLVFENAFAVAGLSRAAVLAYALEAEEQGRRSALRLKVWKRLHGVCDFWVFLEAGGLLREDFLDAGRDVLDEESDGDEVQTSAEESADEQGA